MGGYSPSTHSTLDRNKGVWERDLRTEFGQVTWSDAVQSIGEIILCNRLTESQYRILHALQRTPQSLNNFYPRISPLCLKCRVGWGLTYTYMAVPSDIYFLGKSLMGT